jgi:hypothetical protein
VCQEAHPDLLKKLRISLQLQNHHVATNEKKRNFKKRKGITRKKLKYLQPRETKTAPVGGFFLLGDYLA